MSYRSSTFIRIGSISTAIIAVFIIIQLFIHSTLPGGGQGNENLNAYAFPAYKLPESVTFADEEVPLNQSDVYEALDRELHVNAYWHSQTLLFIKRANRFFPIIEPILKAEGVPDDFKYLAMIESNLMIRATSPVGAAGIWQIMSDTGKSLGLEINKEVDERYNIEKSTVAACRYLKDGKQRLGSWTLAAASYNGGVAGVKRQMDLQKETNYYNILFGEETGRYVYRIIAAKEIINNQAKYGFSVASTDLYAPYNTTDLEVSTPISNFADFAKSNGTNYKTLKNLNPWLRESFLTNLQKKTYKIKIPNN